MLNQWHGRIVWLILAIHAQAGTVIRRDKAYVPCVRVTLLTLWCQISDCAKRPYCCSLHVPHVLHI
jgi:hypothetical protein